MKRKTIRECIRTGLVGLLISGGLCASAYATPTTHIWTPSTDIQPYGKIHITADYYFPTAPRDDAGNRTFVQQVYGPTFSLLSDKPEENLLGRL